MEHLTSLSEILNALYNLGYTEHFYLQNGVLLNAGLEISKADDWFHCKWHDPLTDESVNINCCISSCGKMGIYLD